MNVGDRAVWPLVAPLDRADRYLYPFFPPAQQRGEGRNDQAERLRRTAIWIASLPTPGPTPGQGHPKIPSQQQGSIFGAQP